MATTFELIEAKTLLSNTTSVTFSTIPSTFTDLALYMSVRSTGSTNWQIRLAPNASASGSSRQLAGGGSGSGYSQNTGSEIWLGDVQNTSQTASTFGSYSVYIPNYRSSSNKSISTEAVNENNATAAQMGLYAGLWTNTAAITSLVLDMYSDQFATNSTFYLYGVKNA